jgi:hypothetical protein
MPYSVAVFLRGTDIRLFEAVAEAPERLVSEFARRPEPRATA